MKQKIVGILLILSLFSCGKRQIYFQQLKESENTNALIKQYPRPETVSHVIREGDVLRIKLYSDDDILKEVFNSSLESTPAGISGFVVKNNGAIFIPFIGVLYVKDLSIDDAQKMIQDSLSSYIKPQKMSLELVAFQVTILGEVITPGTLLVPTDQATIIDVIALSGDLSRYGNGRNIKLIRSNGQFKQNHVLDITDLDVFNDPFYYVQSNDIIYVETLKRSFVQENVTFIALLSAVVNTAVVVSLRVR